MELEAIPGVGKKTAAALSELDDAARALETGDVLALTNAPGLSPGRAAQIARGAIQARHGDNGAFLATTRARQVYDDVLSLVKARAVTEYGRRRLETLYPSASASRIEEVREFTERAVGTVVDDAVLEALTGVEPLVSPRDVTVRDRCLATGDAETYATAREAVPEVSVELVEDARGIRDLARGYSSVVVLDESFAGIAVDGDVRVEPNALDDPVSVVPERTLAFFARNRDRIQAAIAVHDADTGLDAPDGLADLEDALAQLDSDGTVRGDDELTRLQTAIDDLDTAVSAAESVANDQIRDAIGKRDVTIEGTDLLSLVERGAGVDSILSRELADEYADAVDAARDHLVDALELDDGETEVARRVFQDEPTFPVAHDDRVVSQLRDDLVAARDRRATRRKRDLARALADHRATCESLVRAALERDVELAVARFAADYDCTFPAFEGSGFAIEDGRSPLLDESFENVDPVDYAVDGVSLLSGVNSGGKTSTLDLVATVVVLAHMGLPVPAASARVGRVDELHYHAKTQGTLDAGAFESTVRDFAALTAGDARKLVLVDELESITEPGASAKIIAGILEHLTERNATAVFVSHLAGEIRDVAGFDVPVDGIEAVGLVDGELVVNRTPVKNHLARSTPELIVEKLATEQPGGFYERLLEKFEQ